MSLLSRIGKALGREPKQLVEMTITGIERTGERHYTVIMPDHLSFRYGLSPPMLPNRLPAREVTFRMHGHYGEPPQGFMNEYSAYECPNGHEITITMLEELERRLKEVPIIASVPLEKNGEPPEYLPAYL